MYRPRFARTLMALSLAGLIAAPGLVLAGDGHWGKHHRADPEKMVERLSDRLDLTATQRDELAALFADGHSRTSGLRDEMHALRKELHQVSSGADYNDQRVREIAGRIAELTEQLTLEMAQGRQALWQLLTPEQQQTFAEMEQRRQQKHAEWREKRAEKFKANENRS